MTLAIRLQKVAARLINRYGAPLTVTVRTALPQRDINKPWRGSTGTQSITVKAVQYAYEDEEIQDMTWRQSNTRFLISEVDINDVDQFNSVDITTAIDLEDMMGQIWSIDNVEIIEPGDDRVAYILYAMR